MEKKERYFIEKIVQYELVNPSIIVAEVFEIEIAEKIVELMNKESLAGIKYRLLIRS